MQCNVLKADDIDAGDDDEEEGDDDDDDDENLALAVLNQLPNLRRSSRTAREVGQMMRFNLTCLMMKHNENKT